MGNGAVFPDILCNKTILQQYYVIGEIDDARVVSRKDKRS